MIGRTSSGPRSVVHNGRSMPDRPTISAIILTRDREAALRTVLERLRGLPVDEVVVADNGSSDGTAALVDGWDRGVRRVDLGGNAGIAGRNAAVRAARGELLLFLDDDSYPLPGAVELLREHLLASPQTGLVGGLVLDVTARGEVLRGHGIGTFDWFLRRGRRGPTPAGGIPTFFFPEGAALARREAFLGAGGFFEPYFFTLTEVDLSTRLIRDGWEVGYVPEATFHHLKDEVTRIPRAGMLRLAVRNQLWYFWRHFPALRAARRIAAYLAFDLVMCVAWRAPGAWAGGIADAWRDRDAVRGSRRPLSRAAVRRAELDRGRIHVRLLAGQLVRRARRLRGLAGTS
jgi:GT2 family glycosyltransferase